MTEQVPGRDANVFVSSKGPANSADPLANTCWCHAERDKNAVGTSFIAVTSEGNGGEDVLEFCPKFFAELLQVSLGLHMGALQGNITAWPLVEIKLEKGEPKLEHVDISLCEG